MSKKNKKHHQNSNAKKQNTKLTTFIENWLWLITLAAIVLLSACFIIFVPMCNEAGTCDSCAANITACWDDIFNKDEGAPEQETVTPVSASDVEQLQMPQEGEQIAVFETSMGTIKFRLFPDRAPKSVENFTTHITNGYYNGVTFHRVMNEFMIQGGDPTATGRGGESIWGGSFEDEFNNGLYNFRGALSMANTGEANSNTSQFFIVQAHDAGVDEATLTNAGMPSWAASVYQQIGGYPVGDHCIAPATRYLGHTVFGQVIEGMDVVDAIAAVEVDSATSKPLTDVVIVKAYLENYTAAVADNADTAQ